MQSLSAGNRELEPVRLGKMHKTLLIAVGSVVLGACSVQRLAINSIGDVLASGDSVFERDDDPDLIAEALPFSLKLLDSLLAREPEHRGLLLAAARGYVLYGYAFVDLPAEQAALHDIERAVELRRRSRSLFLRAHDYAIRALALDYPGIATALTQDPDAAVTAVGTAPERDAAALYWPAAALALAISVSKNEPALLARLPEAEAMLRRALELDESWNGGALHEFAINLAGAGSAAIDDAALEEHYERALVLSRGNRASVYVTYAEVVAVPDQDRSRFAELLRRALAIDLDLEPSGRLLNVITQRRAQWLLDNIDELFLE